MARLDRRKIEQITMAPIVRRGYAVETIVGDVTLKHRNVPDLSHPARVVVFRESLGGLAYGLDIDGEWVTIGSGSPESFMRDRAAEVATAGHEWTSTGCVQHGYYFEPRTSA